MPAKSDPVRALLKQSSKAWDLASLQNEVDALKATVADGAKEQSVVTHLRTLGAKSVTVDLLLKTGVGKVVRRLRKHESTEVSAMAAALVKTWKALLPAQTTTGQTAEPISRGVAVAEKTIVESYARKNRSLPPAVAAGLRTTAAQRAEALAKHVPRKNLNAAEKYLAALGSSLGDGDPMKDLLTLTSEELSECNKRMAEYNALMDHERKRRRRF